jgi:hypothetical protein
VNRPYRPGGEPVLRVKNSRPAEPAPSIADLLTALIERIDAAELAAQAREEAAIARHAEILQRLAAIEDVAQCNGLAIEAVRTDLGTYDLPVDED